MELIISKDYNLIHSIITNPKLWELEYGQGHDINEFEVDTTFDYLVIVDNNQILGCFQTRALTKVLLEAHIYLLPEYWGKDYSKQALKTLFSYVKKYTSFYQVFTDVPEVCVHVIKLMHEMGCTQAARIESGVIYNNKLMALLLFTYNVRQEECEFTNESTREIQ